jgi:RimJ/RimL family protein N-acetyltransferase
MEIRLLTEHDAEAWWNLRLLGLTTDPASFAESADEHRRKTIDEARTFLRACSPENFVVGGFEDGQLAAMAGFYRERHDKFRHKGTIWSVYVREESRGKGSAKALLAEIIRRVRLVEGIEQINLIVSATQPVAKRVYSSLGFKHYGTEPRSLKVGSTYIDDELMVLYL